MSPGHAGGEEKDVSEEEQFEQWWSELEAVLDRKPEDVELCAYDGALSAYDADDLERWRDTHGRPPKARCHYRGYAVHGGHT